MRASSFWPGLAAAAAPAIVKAIATSQFSKDLERTNFRGATVSLAGGPALAATATVTAAAGAADARTAAAVLTAGLGSGAVGLYDDIVGARPEQKGYKGFAGHLRGLREGRLTGGAAKIAGVGASALLASAMLPSKRRGFGRVVEVALGAGVIAGSANLLNLLDLRPGRALKSSLLVAGPLSGGRQGAITAGPMGAAGALLPQDLGEEIMLGDTGANALGACWACGWQPGRAASAGPPCSPCIAALTLASEKVSFTKVIEKTPGLREIDGWGRRP